ncbi:FAD-binding protein [Amycolatopsis sp. CA-230715]|uniref:FAD-binding protein n=1 Tax=Amycolatopsis sp. CA-230715 TaxID=2745196 RepID=UPI001C01C64A|nr:FAD-binding protein [Amycolatopsis sp. CA-230715]QWF85420.1 putative oxidoreductase ORF5 in fasciation locus [Amycolatopsis sp. CA-230715]
MADFGVADGEVRTDGEALDAAARDFGGHVSRKPAAVVRPGSVDDVVAVVRWAGEHGMPVSARGAGHSMNGQAQVDGGVVLDMRSLNQVREIGEDRVTVDAGALWSEVAAATIARGLTPPVFTDYLETTVGGTLSVGGVGGTTHRHGAQTDTVLDLTVVTGTGEVVTCSAERNPGLFDAVRAGLGQAGIVVGATIKAQPARGKARCFRLPHTDLRAFTADQRRLVLEGRFDYIEGFAGFTEDGTLAYQVEAAAFADSLSDVDNEELVRGLAHDRDAVEVTDTSYAEFLDRLAPGVALRKETAEWGLPHPWLNVFVPDSAADGFIETVLAELTPADLENFGLVLTYPLRRELLTTPLLRVPDEPLVFLFALLVTADPGDDTAIGRMAERNRRLYEYVLRVGGTLYPIGPPSLDPHQWAAHYGALWPRVEAAKAEHDPRGVLTPRPGLWRTQPITR